MKGFTLFEILVTILILTFIIGGIYGVLNISTTNYNTNLVSLNLQRMARQGMSWLSREIRQACLSTIVVEVDGNNNNIITFNTLDATGIKYYVENNTVAGKTLWQLKREYPTGTVIIRANDITGLSFPARSAGSNIQKIILGTSKTFFSGGKERTLAFNLTEQVQVRNP
jgi:prepilin-type N-terminal cleavage/methylation domain-containing protein